MRKDEIQNTNGELAWIRHKEKRWALNIIKLVSGGKSWGNAYLLAVLFALHRK